MSIEDTQPNLEELDSSNSAEIYEKNGFYTDHITLILGSRYRRNG